MGRGRSSNGTSRTAVAPAWAVAPGVSAPPAPSSYAPAPPAPTAFVRDVPPPPPLPPTPPPFPRTAPADGERPTAFATPSGSVPVPAADPAPAVAPLPLPAAPIPAGPIPATRRSAQRVALLCTSAAGGGDRPRRALAVAPDPTDAPGAVGELEAAAFAGRFVAEFLSWDEDDPARRAEVLRPLLRDPSGATLGWSGTGRQRVETVLPGRTLRTPGGGVIVEVTARVRTFRRTGPSPVTDPRPSDGPTPGASCCPPDSSPTWVPTDAVWTRVAPPVVRLPDGELRIDLALTARGSQR